jgi:hypothetical protein
VNALFAVGSLEDFLEDLWLAISIQKIEFCSKILFPCFCYTKVQEKESEKIWTNHEYYDENGNPLLKVEGLCLKRISARENAFEIEAFRK